VKTIRIFVAIELSETIRLTLEQLQHRLKRTGVDIRWLRPESMHLTLAFLGDLTGEQWAVNDLLLVQSELKPEGAKHTVLHRVPLQGGAEL
jgi:2'-5' RNA ligase